MNPKFKDRPGHEGTLSRGPLRRESDAGASAVKAINFEGVVHVVRVLLEGKRRQTVCGINLADAHYRENNKACFCWGCRFRSWDTTETVTCIECIVLLEE